MSLKLKSNRATLSGTGVLRGSLVVTLIVIAFVLISPFAGAQKVAEDLPAGPLQVKATTSCLECHEARIILQQRLSKAAWTKEVDKMIKWGAVVDTNDHDALIDYLSTDFGPDQPAYDAPRTSSVKDSGKNSAKKTAQ